MSVSMRKALIIWEEYIEAKSRNEALFLRSVSIKCNLKKKNNLFLSLYNGCLICEPTSLAKYLI